MVTIRERTAPLGRAVRSLVFPVAVCLLSTSTLGAASDYLLATMARDIGDFILPTYFESTPGGFVEMGGIVYFFGNDGIHGQELWRSDLTEEGTWMVQDICSGFCHGPRSSPPIVSDGEQLYFIADDGSTGLELWASQGTADTTRRVSDLRVGPEGSSCYQLLATSGTVYFGADDGVHGCELWVTDGTLGGTQMLVDAVPGSGPGISNGSRRLFPLGELLLFWSGDTLWRSDGSPIGTQSVVTAPAQLQVSWFRSDSPREFKGRLYFSGWDVLHGWELWATDGTESGTELVADIRPGVDGSYPADLVLHGGELWFGALDQDGIARLWRTDGSIGGTSSIPVTLSYPSPLGSSLGGVLFARWDGPAGHQILAAYDGTEVVDLEIVDDSFFNFFEPRLQLPNGLFFAMNSGSVGTEPWITEGTPETTFLLADIAPGSFPSIGNSATDLPSVLSTGEFLFKAVSMEYDFSPWISDGTSVGTGRVRQLNQQTSSSWNSPSTLYSYTLPIGRRCLTTGYKLEHEGTQVWATAGAPTSTAVLPPFEPSGSTAFLTFPGPFPTTGERAILKVKQVDVTHLWGTDGTPAGTDEISAAFGPVELDNSSFVSLAGSVLIDLDDVVWRSDGTLAGTQPLAPLIDAKDGASTSGRSYLSAGGPGEGVELWLIPDGEVPQPIADIEPGPGSSTPSWLITDRDTDRGVFFFAATNAAGREPWYSDGSPNGTHSLGDLLTGPEDSRELTEFPRYRGDEGAFLGSRILFAADDGVFGNELWISDGSPDSAMRLADLFPGGPASNPAWFT